MESTIRAGQLLNTDQVLKLSHTAHPTVYLILFHTAYPCGVPDIVSHCRVVDIVSDSRTKLLPSTGHENNTAQPKPDNCLTLSSASHCSPFICCLRVVLYELDTGITTKIRMLCFVLINSVLLNFLCVWILYLINSPPLPCT